MIKRFISFFTAAAIAITTVFMFDVPNIVAQAVTASGDYGNGVKWSLDNSGELTISGDGNMPNWDETQRPYKSYLNNITSVKIENGVTSIGLCAFYGCNALKAVAISSSVISIGDMAFSECTALETIILPDNVKSIGTRCFSDCTKLKNITISNSLKTIGRNAFDGCNALEVITIPSSVTSIGMSAFNGCSNLKNVTLEGTTPPTVQSNSFPSEVIAFNVPCSSFNDYKTTGNWTNYATKIQPQHSGATEVRNVKAATCTAKGYTGDTYCKVCDTKLETGTEIAMTAHSYSTAWLKDSSNHWHKCENCTAVNDKAAHTWDSGTVTTEPTCTQKGVKTYTCTVCPQTKTEEIAAKGHTEVTDPAVAATCTTAGKTEGKHCSVCNAVITAQTTVPASEHSYVDGTCTSCGNTDPGYVPPHEHNFVNGVCECGETDPNYEPPHEHNFVNGVCDCGATDPNYEPPHVHDFVNGVCDCGETDPNYVPPHNHTFVDGVCECGATDPNYEPPHVHDFVNGVCECGATDPSYVPPHEHDFVNGTCECGATDPTYNPSGNVTADVQDTAGTNAGLVQGNTLIENVLTPEDKTEVENGSSFEIVLEVTDIKDSVSPTDVTAASSALKSDEEIGVYVDLSLFKIKDGTEKTPIHNANGQIGITLTIPDTIFASDRTYSIIRVHGGIAENLGGTYDKTSRKLTFFTDKFSTYAIAYTASNGGTGTPSEPSTPTIPSPPSGGTTPVSPSVPVVTPTVTETVTKTEEEVIADEPYIEDVSSAAGIYENDDNSQSPLYMIVIIIAIAVVGFSSIIIAKHFAKNNQ